MVVNPRLHSHPLYLLDLARLLLKRHQALLLPRLRLRLLRQLPPLLSRLVLAQLPVVVAARQRPPPTQMPIPHLAPEEDVIVIAIVGEVVVPMVVLVEVKAKAPVLVLLAGKVEANPPRFNTHFYRCSHHGTRHRAASLQLARCRSTLTTQLR